MIPARGGSKGIPGKNLRPFLGKPLIHWTIDTAQSIPGARVIVNTESQQIKDWVSKHSPMVEIYDRPKSLALDQTTLDEVAFDMAKSLKIADGILITLQPTSPLLRTDTLVDAIASFKDNSSECLVSVTEDRKLSWNYSSGYGFRPNFEKRVNRQELPPVYSENGAIIICQLKVLLDTGSRISAAPSCFHISKKEAIDIDSPNDWYEAEYFAKGTSLYFVIEANRKIGSGHLYRALTLAENFPQFHIEFILLDTETKFVNMVKQLNYSFQRYKDFEEFAENASLEGTRAIIFDWLDTSVDMLSAVRDKSNAKIISFEDLGSGANETDLTINELYPPTSNQSNILSGPDYCVMRQEFYNVDVQKTERTFDVLIAFGGTDPNNQTSRALAILQSVEKQLKIAVLLGIGAQGQLEQVREISDRSRHQIEVFADLKNVSDLMADSRVCITSSGRTVYELNVCRTKTVCICQNSRELTHMFARENNGIVNLGLFSEVSDEKIRDALIRALQGPPSEQKINVNPEKSLHNVVAAINAVIGAT